MIITPHSAPESGPTTDYAPLVLERLESMREHEIWPNGGRSLIADAFGVMVLAALHRSLGEEDFLRQAEEVVTAVESTLAEKRGLKISDTADGNRQFYHYLVLWALALHQLSQFEPAYHEHALELIRAIHPAFVLPGRGVYRELRNDLRGAVRTAALSPLNLYYGYVFYRIIDQQALAPELTELASVAEHGYQQVPLKLAPEAGMLLWLTHFFPEERWAFTLRKRALDALEPLWRPQEGCFIREKSLPGVRIAYENYAVALGLSAVGEWPERVERLHQYFENEAPGPDHLFDPLTHVMGCVSFFSRGFIAGEPASGFDEPPRR